MTSRTNDQATREPQAPIFLGGGDVEALLTYPECIAAMEEALRALAVGEAVQPLRSVTWLPDRRGLIATMPGHLGRTLGLKVITVFHRDAQGAAGRDGGGEAGAAKEADGAEEGGGAGPPSHQGFVVLFDAGLGRPLALVDAAAITAIRTAAVSALATRLLARPEAGDLALLGAGVQAGSHLAALASARSLRRVRVWSRNAERARAFAVAAGRRHGIEVETAGSAREAVSGADLICTVTAAREPVLAGEWIAAGAHVNAVGSSVSTTRELDAHAVARARLFVDRRESTLAESGDFLMARAEGVVGDGHIAGELGELLTGRVVGRRGADEITLFKSLGLAVEDLAAAELVYRKARAAGRGTPLVERR